MKLHAVLTAAFVVFASSSALAGTLPVGPAELELTITSTDGGAPVHLALQPTVTGSGAFRVSGGDVIANRFSYSFGLGGNVDPSVSGSFTLINLSSATQTFSVSATLGVSPIGAPTRIGGSYGPMTYTDVNLDSSVTLASAIFYQARIDGVGVHDLGSFNVTASGGAGAFGTDSGLDFGTPIPSLPGGPAVTTSIGVAFPGFSLTAGDSVSTAFEFAVVPEPGFVSLFALAVVGTYLGTRNFFHQGKRV
jgi:hypothetical protein